MEGRAVAVMGDALADTQRAFDGVASTYDRSNTGNATLREMRRRTLAAVTAHVPAGSRLIDLGCGPGADAEQLARQGYHVVAIDWSPAMVAEASRRVALAKVADRVDVRHVGIQQLDRLAPDMFDAAWSNFGPLNCVPSLPEAARHIAGRMRAGGVLGASVIGRLCSWELALYLRRGDWARVRIRFAHDLVSVPLEGR